MSNDVVNIESSSSSSDACEFDNDDEFPDAGRLSKLQPVKIAKKEGPET